MSLLMECMNLLEQSSKRRIVGASRKRERLSVTNLSLENNLPMFRLNTPVVIRMKGISTSWSKSKLTQCTCMYIPECQYLLSGMVGSQGSSDSLLSVGSYNYTMEVIRILTKSPSNRVLIRDLKKVFFVENTFSTKCLGSGSQDDQNGTHFALERSVSLTLPLATSLNSFVTALSNYGNRVSECY